jgi:hypothetical protein
VRIFFFLSFLALTACGNADQGKGTKKNKAAATLAAVTQTQSNDLTGYGPCVAMQVLSSSGYASASELNGSSVCAHLTKKDQVRLKVSANFSTTNRYCLVPVSYSGLFTPNCFTIDGQADVVLSTDQFTDVALVAENNLNAFNSYATGITPYSYPSYGYARLR